ncbi:tyrosine-type recombinase/integrase [uncultured Shimia sp.]|uniref:tyrosine-type recombinase/integrase n=1 Tax=uncultured Shimia sp. TaxID=573152 RepID=UPI0025CB9B0A|nr:tyrosine-type recombinase/integrase [uncultured Shimia sp.]
MLVSNLDNQARNGQAARPAHKAVLDKAKASGFLEGENPVTAVKEAGVSSKVHHHDAMPWQGVSAYYAKLVARFATAAKALQFTILTGCHTSEVLDMTWGETDWNAQLWTIPKDRMKGGKPHRVPVADEMLRILEPMKAMALMYVFESQKRHHPLSNISMLMLLRRMGMASSLCMGFVVLFGIGRRRLLAHRER